MSLDWNRAIPLDKPGTIEDLRSANIESSNGRPLVLYEADGDDDNRHDDLLAVGVARVDPDESRWVAEGWEPTFHFSDLDEPARSLYKEMRPENGDPF